MNMTTFFLLTILIVGLYAGNSLYKQDKEKQEFRDIDNFTESKMVWNYTVNNSVTKTEFIIHKTVDWLGAVTFELGKVSMKYGYTDKINIKGSTLLTIGKWIKIILIIWIFSMIIPTLIPLAALIFILGQGIYKIYLKIKSKCNAKQ